MGLFFDDYQNSSTIAKDRLKTLILAERIHCSPNILKMLKNDMILTANKYVIIKENQVTVTYDIINDMVTACFPLEHNHLRKRNRFTNV